MTELRGSEPVDRHGPRRGRRGRSWRERCGRRRRRVVPAPATITLLGSTTCAGLVVSSLTEGLLEAAVGQDRLGDAADARPNIALELALRPDGVDGPVTPSGDHIVGYGSLSGRVHTPKRGPSRFVGAWVTPMTIKALSRTRSLTRSALSRVVNRPGSAIQPVALAGPQFPTSPVRVCVPSSWTGPTRGGTTVTPGSKAMLPGEPLPPRESRGNPFRRIALSCAQRARGSRSEGMSRHGNV